MFVNRMLGLLLLGLLMTVLSFNTQSQDDQPIFFGAKPSKCVALHQGQMCYSTITFNWQAKQGKLAEQALCLHQQGVEQPLVCWLGKEALSFEHSFESSQTLNYSLRTADDAQLLATTKVSVAWVYKSSRQSRSGWRMF